MAATTIKVSPAVRDRLNAVAAQHGLTAGSMLEKILDEWLWRQRVELAKRQMRGASPDVWQEYLDEARAWDVTLADGLDADPWQR